jgi:hypothetical protein
VITDGVVPWLHVDSKRARIKQSPKQGRALRPETTINDPRDVGIGKRLHNLPARRAVGVGANRRLLDVQRLSHDCTIGEATFPRVTRPAEVDGQRAPALRFEQARTQALLSCRVLFGLLPEGFSTRDVRPLLAALLGLAPSASTPGRLSYDLRRLRLHGLIERRPGTHRYRPTAEGLRIALFFTRTYARLLRPGLAQILPARPAGPSPLRAAFDRLDQEICRGCIATNLAG